MNDPAASRLVRAIADAVAIGIVFPRLDRTLIVDTRADGDNGPAVLLEGRIDTPQALLQAIRRHRPALGELSQFSYAPWHDSTHAFADGGPFQAIIARLEALESPDAVRDARIALADLTREERERQ
ncbi:MAG: hypothetical protein ACR2M3_09325 [Thermomicrobiales bacterium]